MIDGYPKVGNMKFARALFEVMSVSDVVWSMLISRYAQKGQPNEAVNIFVKMEAMNVKHDEFIMVSWKLMIAIMINFHISQFLILSYFLHVQYKYKKE